MGAALGGRGHLRLRPVRAAPRGLLHRRPASHGLRLPACGPRLLLHAHRHHRPFPAHAGQSRLLPHGLGRQRPAHRAPRAELLRRALRPGPALRPRLHPAALGRRGRVGQSRRSNPDLATQLRRAVRTPDGRGRGAVRSPVAPPGPECGLDAALPDHRNAGPQSRPSSLPAQPGARRGLPGGCAGPVGRDLRHRGGPGRAGVARLPRLLPPSRLSPRRPRRCLAGRRSRRPRRGGPDRHQGRLRRDDPPRAPARVRRPGRPSRRRAIQAAVRHDGRLPRLRRRSPRPAPPRGGDGQGRRHRHVLHLRGHHRHRLVARSRPAAARHPAQGRPPGDADTGMDHRRPRSRGLRRHGRQDRLHRPRDPRRSAHGRR